MAFNTKIEGDTGEILRVNASKEALAVLDQARSSVKTFSENDDGTVTGEQFTLSPESSDDYRLRVGVDQSIFNLAFEGTNIARDRIQQNDTTATSAQASGFLTLNSGNSTTSGQGSNIRTYRTFPLFGSYPTYFEFWAKINNPTATNALTEFGAGYVSGVTVQLTDGVLFRQISGGQGRLVLVNNSTDLATADIDTTDIPSRDGTGAFDYTEVNRYTFTIHTDSVRLWINNALVATLRPAGSVTGPTQAIALPLFARVYNSGTASAARSLGIGMVNVSTGDQNTGKTWGQALCGMGGGAYQIQPGTTSGPTTSRGAVAAAGWPNSTQARAAGTWTATTAPATNSLGGQWVSPAISTLTTEADYPVFSYLNPAGSATLPGKTLYITGVRWGKTVALAAASTNSINLNYLVGVGGTSSATTATEGAAIVAARGVMCDTIPFKSTAVVGDYVEGGDLDLLDSPLVVPPGCYLLWVVRPFGTVTSNTLTVAGTVAFIGYHG